MLLLYLTAVIALAACDKGQATPSATSEPTAAQPPSSAPTPIRLLLINIKLTA